jgi:hypothetical protein
MAEFVALLARGLGITVNKRPIQAKDLIRKPGEIRRGDPVPVREAS